MNSAKVIERKQKLNTIIMKITDFQLLKIKSDTNSGDCNRQLNTNSQERDIEMNNVMGNEKENFGGPGLELEAVGPSAELPGAMPKPVGRGANL